MTVACAREEREKENERNKGSCAQTFKENRGVKCILIPRVLDKGNLRLAVKLVRLEPSLLSSAPRRRYCLGRALFSVETVAKLIQFYHSFTTLWPCFVTNNNSIYSGKTVVKLI